MFIPQEINFSFNLIFNLAQGSATMAEIMMEEQLKYKSNRKGIRRLNVGQKGSRGNDNLPYTLWIARKESCNSSCSRGRYAIQASAIASEAELFWNFSEIERRLKIWKAAPWTPWRKSIRSISTPLDRISISRIDRRSSLPAHVHLNFIFYLTVAEIILIFNEIDIKKKNLLKKIS